MKKITGKRLPLHRETLAPLQGSKLAGVAGGSDYTTSLHMGCHNGGPSTGPTC